VDEKSISGCVRIDFGLRRFSASRACGCMESKDGIVVQSTCSIATRDSAGGDLLVRPRK